MEDYNNQNITNVSQEWQDNINRWRFYQNSYAGGDQYANGEYLTHYVYEDQSAYRSRIQSTPLDNHCRNIIQIYSSFLFATSPRRDLTGLEMDPALDLFLEDSDMEGRSLDAFLADAHTQASIYGHAVLIVDRPNVTISTRADELEAGVRPYLSLFNAENVLDWEWRRKTNGGYELSRLKVLEHKDTKQTVFRIYYPEYTEVVTVKNADGKVKNTETTDNALGYIPAVWLYNQRSGVKGIGVSDLADISDLQRAIYDHTSELDQTLKLSNHPSIVATGDVDLNAGPGSVITIPQTMDPGIKPYIIQPGSQGIGAILDSINSKVEAIDRISHLGGVRATAKIAASGVALMVERQLLNARLQEKSNNMMLAEEQMWNVWADWQNAEWTGTIEYPSGFNLRDTNAELQNLKLAREIGVTDIDTNHEIERRIAELVIVDKDRLDKILKDPDGADIGAMKPGDGEAMETLTSDNWRPHVKDMLANGYTMAEIEVLHPEITQLMLAEV
tara:strand:+ start:2990 stop:4495 length:1506 start_codon:yes stop_codon:yes gene_type:complete